MMQRELSESPEDYENRPITPGSGNHGRDHRVFPFSQAARQQRRQYHAQKQQYREEKKRQYKRAGYDLDTPPIKSGHLKLRTTIRSWPKFYCELRPGMMIYYKEDRHDIWMGTILLHGGVIMERPSKREGFTFKFSHPLRQPIYAQKGPNGETFINMLRMPSDHCIVRVSSEDEGREWINGFISAMDADLPSRSTSLSGPYEPYGTMDDGTASILTDDSDSTSMETNKMSFLSSTGSQANMEAIKFKEQLQEQCKLDLQAAEKDYIDSDDLSPPMNTDHEIDFNVPAPPVPVVETAWIPTSLHFDYSQFSHMDTDVLDEFWKTASSTRAGSSMILAARMSLPWSYAQEWANLFTHSYFLTDAAFMKSPKSRMTCVARFFLTGLSSLTLDHRRPYPGRPSSIYRACFSHPPHANSIGSARVFYISEHLNDEWCALSAVSRRCGWTCSGSLKASNLFIGRQMVTTIQGSLSVHLLHFNEEYVITFPDIISDGLALGEVLTTLRGPLSITNSSQNLKFEIDVGQHCDHFNGVIGQLYDNHQSSLVLQGHWDSSVSIFLPDEDEDSQVLYTLDECRPMSVFSPSREDLWNSEEVADICMCDAKLISALRAESGSAQALIDRRVRQISSTQSAMTPKFFQLDDDKWVPVDLNLSAWDHLKELYEYQMAGLTQSLDIDHAVELLGDGTQMASSNELRHRKRSISETVQHRRGYADGTSDFSEFAQEDSTGWTPTPPPAPRPISEQADQILEKIQLLETKVARTHELVWALAVGLALMVLLLLIIVLTR